MELEIPKSFKTKACFSTGNLKWQGFKPTIEPSFFAPHLEQLFMFFFANFANRQFIFGTEYGTSFCNCQTIAEGYFA
jgi:hypothetical protein